MGATTRGAQGATWCQGWNPGPLAKHMFFEISSSICIFQLFACFSFGGHIQCSGFTLGSVIRDHGCQVQKVPRLEPRSAVCKANKHLPAVLWLQAQHVLTLHESNKAGRQYCGGPLLGSDLAMLRVYSWSCVRGDSWWCSGDGQCGNSNQRLPHASKHLCPFGSIMWKFSFCF